MALQNQIYIYSVDTASFYNKNELKIHNKLQKLYKLRSKFKKKLKKSKNKTRTTKNIKKCSSFINKLKKDLYAEFPKNKSIRNLNEDFLTPKRVVGIFESTLTRTLEIPNDSLSTDIFIVQTYFFDIIKDIIINGFYYKNEKYIVLTASAGQIRTKKTVFIKESLWLQHEKTLMCGLTRDFINEMGGININKFLAYLALSNSATDKWSYFDITKSIVVDDMETNVLGLVDFIDDNTYQIERKEMEIPIVHTDGCGIMLPSVSKKSFMIRLPWVKGLLVPFAYDDFIREKNGNSKIKDIYGKEWDIFKDDIQVIFTKSQFKMYKYYKSWQEYCENFKKYNCQAGKCNEEGSLTNDAKIGYQMLQTLVDMNDSEIEQLTQKTRDNIKNICKDKNIMLKMLGVTKSNKNKNYMQQALELYPLLLNDYHNKNIVEQVKKSLVKEARSGKVTINGKYTFLIPDLYAFAEYLFLGKSNPEGLLKNNEVYCGLYSNNNELACLRSPHLYKEWAIRNNVVNEEKSKWFITTGIYTSCHDLISKILQFDNDGDCSLVVAEDLLINIAKRNMEGVVPLYYNMAKAGGWEISNSFIFLGLKHAYTGGRIGDISNDITKIINSDKINFDVIKLLCMENNFTIDYAKTLYKPERPPEVNKLIRSYTKSKLPYFFIYAKDKTKSQVEKPNNSVINRICKMITNPRFKVESQDIGKFDYRILMQSSEIKIDNAIIDIYNKLDLHKYTLMNNKKDIENYSYIYKNIREQILNVNSDIYYVVDVLVEYLYNIKNVKCKTTLWNSFGDILVNNIQNNVTERYTYCEKCGELIEQINNKIKFCKKCAKEILQEQKNKWKREKWNGRKIENP